MWIPVFWCFLRSFKQLISCEGILDTLNQFSSTHLWQGTQERISPSFGTKKNHPRFYPSVMSVIPKALECTGGFKSMPKWLIRIIHLTLCQICQKRRNSWRPNGMTHFKHDSNSTYTSPMFSWWEYKRNNTHCRVWIIDTNMKNPWK